MCEKMAKYEEKRPQKGEKQLKIDKNGKK